MAVLTRPAVTLWLKIKVRLGEHAMVAAAGEIAGRQGKVVRVEGKLLLVPRFRLQRKTLLLRPGVRLCLKSHLRAQSFA